MNKTVSELVTALALDVGSKRIGVAIARLDTRFARPLTTLQQPQTFYEDIRALCEREHAKCLVLGLPRNLAGQETAQTETVRRFGDHLKTLVAIPVYWTDEAATSLQAEAELEARGKLYDKAEIDALAATYILDDFLGEHPEILHD